MARSLLLIAEAGASLRRCRNCLTAEGFRVDSASGWSHGVELLAMRDYDGVVLAAGTGAQMMAALNALRPSLIRALPLLCLVDVSIVEEIALLAAGASLCLSYAEDMVLVLAQLRALFAIVEGFPPHHRVGDLGIDPVARRASRSGAPLALRRKEFELLLLLAERAGQVVPAEALHAQVWPQHSFCPRRVALQMHKLRRALGRRERTPLLHTIRGRGYVLASERDRHALPH